MSEETQEGSITTPLGSLSLKGKKTAELISILCLSLTFLLAYVLFEHKADAKDFQSDLKSVLKEMVQSQRDMVQAQREQNCLIALPQDRRDADFCKRITR